MLCYSPIRDRPLGGGSEPRFSGGGAKKPRSELANRAIICGHLGPMCPVGVIMRASTLHAKAHHFISRRHSHATPRHFASRRHVTSRQNQLIARRRLTTPHDNSTQPKSAHNSTTTHHRSAAVPVQPILHNSATTLRAPPAARFLERRSTPSRSATSASASCGRASPPGSCTESPALPRR